jgi:hypothetical protein
VARPTLALLAIMLSSAPVGAGPGESRVLDSCIQANLAKLEQDAAHESDPSVPAFEARYGEERPPDISVFAVLPADGRQYKKVYGSNATYSQTAKDELDLAIARTTGLAGDHVSVRIAGKKGPSEFKALVRRSKGQTIVVVGHNDAGAFMFPNGKSLPVAKMADECQAAGAFCIFLTCEADGLLDGNPCAAGAVCQITAKHATTALTDAVTARTAAADGGTWSAQRLWTEIEASLGRQQRAAQVKYIVAGGFVVAILVTIYSVHEDSSP